MSELKLIKCFLKHTINAFRHATCGIGCSINGAGHNANKIEHLAYVNHRPSHKNLYYDNNDFRHIACKFAHIGDGFGHGAYIFGSKMNEY